MRKVLVILVGTAVLWVPAVSVAGDSSSSSSRTAAKSEALEARGKVSKSPSVCQSKHSQPRDAGANAFGKCVSTLANHKEKSAKQGAKSHAEDSTESEGKDAESAESHSDAGASPATACRAIQANDLAHFQTRYGTRPNAFGKCVAEHANSKQS